MDNSFNPPAEILFEEAQRQKFPWLNVALFGVTCLSTMIVGTALMEAYTNSFGDVLPFLGQIFAFAVRAPEGSAVQLRHHDDSVGARDGALPDVPVLRNRRNSALFHTRPDHRRHDGRVHQN